MSNRTYVIGVGMTKFEKPGTKEGDYPDWAKEAGEKALADAGIPYTDVEQAFAGYCYGDSTYGQRALYQLGLTGIPSSTSTTTARPAPRRCSSRVRRSRAASPIARWRGFEKMEKGSLGVKYTDRTNALDKHAMQMFEIRDPEQSPPAPQMFGNAGRDHMEKYGSNPDHYAWIGWKNHKHSVNNPYAQFQDEYTIEDIKAAKMIHDPLTKLQCSPTSDGSACAIVASERYVEEHNLSGQAIEIAGQSMITDLSSTFAEDTDCMKIVGSDMSKTAAEKAYAEAGISADEVDVCELHDCFSANELITYEALGFAAEGEAHKLVEEEATTYGGKVVVNPSGGLISKGHPLGATGLAQCSELTWQLRGKPTSDRSRARRPPCSTTSASAAPPWSPSTSRRPRGSPEEEGTMAKQRHSIRQGRGDHRGPGGSARRRRRRWSARAAASRSATSTSRSPRRRRRSWAAARSPSRSTSPTATPSPPSSTPPSASSGRSTSSSTTPGSCR